MRFIAVLLFCRLRLSVCSYQALSRKRWLFPNFLIAADRMRRHVVGAPGEGADPVRAVLPQAQTADEGVGIVPQPGSLGKTLELFRVAAADDDVVGLEGGDQAVHDLLDVALPFLAPQAFQ